MYFTDGLIIGIISSMALINLIAFTFGWIWFVKIFNDFKNLAIEETKKNLDL